MDEIGAVYGGGGPFGIGYGLGVAHAVEHRTGVSLANVPSLGTSAGSWVAACLALGLGVADLARLEVPCPPSRGRGVLRDVAAELFGERRVDTMRAGAVRIQYTAHRLLDAGRAAVADVVAASSAVPGLFSPHRIGRGWYVDGGVRTPAAVHRGPPVRDLLVVAPLAGPGFGLAGRASESLLSLEVNVWSSRNPLGRAHVIRPNRKVAALVRRPQDMFDKARALDAYWLGREQVDELFERRPALETFGAFRPAPREVAA